MTYKTLATLFLVSALAACGADDVTFDSTADPTGGGSGSSSGGEASENEAPVAKAGYEFVQANNSTVILDATGSTDADNNIVSYEWRLEGEATPFSTISYTSHTFTASGVKNIVLTVTDSDNASDEFRFSIEIDMGETPIGGGDGGATGGATGGGNTGTGDTGGDTGTGDTGGDTGTGDTGGDTGTGDTGGDTGTGDTGGNTGTGDTGGDTGTGDTGGDTGTGDTGGDTGTGDTGGDTGTGDTGGDTGTGDTGGDTGTGDTGGDTGTGDTGGDTGTGDTGGDTGTGDTGGDTGTGDTGGDTGGEEVSLLTQVANNVISGAPACGSCHNPDSVAAGSGLVFSGFTENIIEAEITEYIVADNPANVQKLKDKPLSDTNHFGRNILGAYPAERQIWESYIDQLVEVINGGPVAVDPQAQFTTSITGLVVDVDASSTVEGSDNTHIYEWATDAGDMVTGQTASFSFPANGDYLITLTVTDQSSGKSDMASESVNVEEILTSSAICQDASLSACYDFEEGLPSDLNGQTSGARTIDTTQGYKSDSSVKVVTAGQDGGFFSIAPPANDFWARVFVKSSGDSAGGSWGGDTQGFGRTHGTLLRGMDGGAELRVGDHRCQLELNRDGGEGHLGDDLEMTSGQYGDDASVCRSTFGARMDPNKWYCLEVHFNAPESEFQVFWDNQNVQQLHVTAERTWTNQDKAPGGQYSMNADQLWGPYNFDSFQFGYEAYGAKPTMTHWYDGVAVSEERIGCGDDYIINQTLDDSTKLGELDNGYPYDESGSTTGGDTSGGGDTGGTETGGGTDGGTDGGTGPVGEGEIIFSENFESYSAGSYPGDWGFFVDQSTTNTALAQSKISVVSDDVNNGSKAVHLFNDSGNNPVQITKVLDKSKFSDTLYLRMYIKQSLDLGRSPGNNHATLVGLRGESQNPNNVEVRFGDAKGVLGININPTDNVSPPYLQWASTLSASDLAAAPMITKDEWHCLELAFLNGGDESQMYVWNDNELVFSHESDADFNSTNQTAAKWLNGQFDEVVIGWQSWSAGINPDIWIDDIVASTGRIGCEL